MARSIVGNRVTSGSDQPPIVRNSHCARRPIARSIVASGDRSYDQSRRPVTDRTINRGVERMIALSILQRKVADPNKAHTL